MIKFKDKGYLTLMMEEVMMVVGVKEKWME